MGSRTVVVAGLTAAFVFACAMGCRGSAPADGVSGSGAGMSGDDASRFDESAIAELIDGSRAGSGGEDDGDGDAGLRDASDGSGEAGSDRDADSESGDAGGDPLVDASTADSSAPQCESDSDDDGVCDDVDTCPVGVESACDAVIWTVELPHDGHVIAEDPAPVWTFAFILSSESTAEIERFDLDMQQDGSLYEYDMPEQDVESIRAFFESYGMIRAEVGVVTFSMSSHPLQKSSAESVCPFHEKAATLSRVTVRGTMRPNGIGSIKIQLRGYVLPAD